MPLSLYPPIPDLQASYHSVTVGVVNTMSFIGTPVSTTHCIFLYRGVGPVCANTGDVVGPTFFLLLEGCGVDSGSTSLVV